jgi:tetratricopeptide (TPR) repeat protein
MKSFSALMAVLLLAGMASAQAGGTQAPPAAQTTPAQGAPAAQGTTGATQGSAAQAPAASRQPQAKTKDEYDAIVAGQKLTDPNQVLAAADQFAQKYPSSELKEILYIQAMNMFQQQNNAEKEIEAGRKAIAIDPTDPIPLIHVASALVEVTHDNDLDKDQRYAEAAKDAQAAIDNIETGLHIPPSVTPQQVAAVKSNIVATAYETLGVIQMHKQDFAAAETDFKRAADAVKGEPMARIYLRLSVAQDNERKYAEALENANKAVQYSQEGTLEKNLAKQQQARLQKLVQAGGNPSLPGPGETPPTAPATNPGNPAGPGNLAQPTPPQPH